MRDALLIFRKEWLNLIGSDRGLFVVYAVLILGWGCLLATWRAAALPIGAGGVAPFDLIATIWYASFSVIVAATFSNTAFVSERISGSLEILLTCGISRSGILYSKIAFIFSMTVLVGGLCLAVANALQPVLNPSGITPALVLGGQGIAVYFGASFFSAASGAFFSVLLPNPRVLHFINLFMVMVLIALYAVLAGFWPVPLYALALMFTLAGTVFTVFARKQFHSERIIKPIVL
jgi:ABC-type Na+ efflux pump permease subunit